MYSIAYHSTIIADDNLARCTPISNLIKISQDVWTAHAFSIQTSVESLRADLTSNFRERERERERERKRERERERERERCFRQKRLRRYEWYFHYVNAREITIALICRRHSEDASTPDRTVCVYCGFSWIGNSNCVFSLIKIPLKNTAMSKLYKLKELIHAVHVHLSDYWYMLW